MQWTILLGESKDQATWTILVVRIVFDYFTLVGYRLHHLCHSDMPNNALVQGMLGKLILPSQNLALDFLKHSHIVNCNGFPLTGQSCHPRCDHPCPLVSEAAAKERKRRRAEEKGRKRCHG